MDNTVMDLALKEAAQALHEYGQSCRDEGEGKAQYGMEHSSTHALMQKRGEAFYAFWLTVCSHDYGSITGRMAYFLRCIAYGDTCREWGKQSRLLIEGHEELVELQHLFEEQHKSLLDQFSGNTCE